MSAVRYDHKSWSRADYIGPNPNSSGTKMGRRKKERKSLQIPSCRKIIARQSLPSYLFRIIIELGNKGTLNKTNLDIKD